jgi:hypothetical protein
MPGYRLPEVPNPSPGRQPDNEEFQADFSGGENSVSDRLLLRPNEVSLALNVYQRRGGGLTARKGFKSLGGVGVQNRNIFEWSQTLPTILTYREAITTYYEEQAQPRFQMFTATPATLDAVYIGAREPWTQMLLNILFAGPNAANTFVWRVSNGAGGWIDKTAQIVEAVANSKQMRGALGEWSFSWPVFTDWLPQIVNTAQYQYWLQILCNLGGTGGGTETVHSQRRVLGNFPGHRIIGRQTTAQLYEWTGTTGGAQLVESWATTYRIQRMRAAQLNDYIYLASHGQRPLRRWNGARLASRSGAVNTPVNAGLGAPPPFTAGNLTQAANPAAYPAGVTLRYRTTFRYGPGGILGESPPCGEGGPPITNEIVTAGVNQVSVNLANAIAAGNITDVHSILLYATDDMTANQAAERSDPSNYYLIGEIVRDSATWVAGTFVDAYTPRIKNAPTPIGFNPIPPFYPKFVVQGGGRLWIADEYNVAWSDIGRGDSWDPANQKPFQNVTGLLWHRDEVMLVFHDNDISYIKGANTGLPTIDFFYQGYGNVQPDSITVAENKVFFMSRLGPTCIFEDDSVRLVGSGRVFESVNYWDSKAGERDLAMGAFFNRRWYIPIDQGGASQFVGRTACLDLQGPREDAGAWSRLIYKESAPQEQVWGALAVIHAPLDHPFARQLILIGVPDANGTTESSFWRLLEYGTSDNWGAAETDGQAILPQVESKALTMAFLNRWKSYRYGHVRYKLPGTGVSLNVYLLADQSATPSRTITIATGVATQRDLKFDISEAASSGTFRDVAAAYHLDAVTNAGFDLFAWWADAEIEEFATT